MALIEERDMFFATMRRRKLELRLFTYTCAAVMILIFVVVPSSSMSALRAQGLPGLGTPNHVQFEYSVSLGSILQIAAFIGGLFVFYDRFSNRLTQDISGLGARITKLESDIAPLSRWWVERMQRLENEHAKRDRERDLD